VVNRSVAEPASLRPRLREGLRFSVQGEGAARVCVIEDPNSSRFHRVGLREYRFLRALDGTRTVASILATLARSGGGESFTEAEALHVVRWLKENHLLEVESDRAARATPADARPLLAAITWLNPLMVKVPLARPDRFFAAVEPALRWALGGLGLVVWLGVVLAGAVQLALEWPRFLRGFEGILARDHWLWLIGVWAALKIAHEFSHGLFCKHFGAAVREVGAIFVLFIPMGYVDATASLGLASRWRRIAVAAAGLYMEFLLAAVAALIWVRTPDGSLATILHGAIVTGTLVTLFFNANPLMRFDGYFILSDLLGLPNLAPRGKQWVHGALAWLLIGGKSLRPARPRSRDEWLVALYGAAAAVWQVIVLAGLLVAASVTLRGGGLFFAVIAAALWVGVPMWNLARTLLNTLRCESGRGSAAALRGALLVALVAGVGLAPFHRTVSSAGVVELADTVVLRAECPGFVAAVHVRDGEQVAAGQLLAALRNDDATAALARSRLQLAEQELRARLAFTREDVSTAQAEQAKAEALRKTVATHESYVATLQIRAPFAGRITARALERMHGAFLRRGEELAHLGRTDGCDVRLAIEQEAEPHFRAAVGQVLQVRIEGTGGSFPATLTRLESRATRDLIDPALTALGGGPLALRRIEDESPRQSAEFELAETHFVALARLVTDEALCAGQMARVKLHSLRTANLWQLAQARFARWLKRFA
jgi:putative peptide zinc metalloprotease protein